MIYLVAGLDLADRTSHSSNAPLFTTSCVRCDVTVHGINHDNPEYLGQLLLSVVFSGRPNYLTLGCEHYFGNHLDTLQIHYLPICHGEHIHAD
jgi:hypothetical protein